MQRRKFLIGVGATASGGAAALGTGAFSRVESQRQVSIEVANDANAYLGMKTLDTPNSNNYVEYDGNGHLTIDVGEHDDFDGPDTQPGEGVNSDSFTWFDGMFQLCNQGKAEANISYELPDPPEERDIPGNWTAPGDGYDEQVVGFYYISEGGDDPGEEGDRIFVPEGDSVPLPVGECREMGVRTVTKGVDATTDAPLIDGDVVVTADSPAAGEPVGNSSDPS
ncbi:hypothetical protein R3751_13870 [Halorubrum distributum]|uniref:hypothetical protein n=1 Tax=Halorubrum distributum TaxID=29283 RepID=UPI002955BEF3|nr:hypothetical protein [Halorubrum distributum]MDV7350863.1 hypothetical protein [Halorubrum distributum]